MDESKKGRLRRFQVQVAAWTSIAVLMGAVWISISPPATTSASPQCRCFPGDKCWPDAAEWASLNNSVDGRLIATVPVAAVCHDGFPGVEYDAEKCAEARANWLRPELHYQTMHSPMAPFFANMSCDPFTPRDAQCVIGAYVPFAVNAFTSAHYKTTISFATKHNIRLVIRNTGHDYMGKSTGAGALALWTHNIKHRKVIDYQSKAYTGKALRVGAGVQAFEAQNTANAAGLVVVEGRCPTVGFAGGYTQGGGTSPLGSKFGLAADQVLEWEVVTARGDLLTATPDENADLYWALAGGGGGTYGVVLSMTVKAHKNFPTAGATLTFVEPTDKYWDIVQAFLLNTPAVLKEGGTLYWMVMPGNTFYMPQSYLPDGMATDLEALLLPTIDALDQAGIEYTFKTADYPNFQDVLKTTNAEHDIVEINLGGRIIPSSLFNNNNNNNNNTVASLTGAIRNIVDNGGLVAGVSMAPSRTPESPNSAHPAWRSSSLFVFLGSPHDRKNMTANIVMQNVVTEEFMAPLERITPEGGAYLNEAALNQADFQHAFYGSNYPKLLSIKKKNDPDGIFWGPTAVGRLRLDP
ncbi:hypothetical protein B0T17DRAFT_501946 [Bombardia bombarda]|uniref:FAD-binding PCMH-type domain-containing protein n=1 Tax=Bombardia bombarda TaxID=252184 RepID=A0AA40CEB1_9PEZI|nr:hypothetical protein B0T17DRAFT_501946 [Bombardia bombarda]